MPSKFGRFKTSCERAVFVLFSLITICVLLLNIKAEPGLLWGIAFVCAAMLCCASFPKIRHGIKRGIRLAASSNIVLIVAIVLGILLRALPLLCDFTWILKDDTGDCAIHFFGAQQLAGDGLTWKNALYESIFVQLYSYTLTLSLFVRLIPDMTRAIIASNILFDAVSVVFLAKLLHSADKNPKLGTLLWCVNPFFIIMCWMPMAVTLVNAILMASLSFGAWLLNRNAGQKAPYGLAALFGLSVFVGNLYRPLFYVLLIAEVIALILQIMVQPQKAKQTLAVILIVVMLALIPGKLYSSRLTAIGGFQIPKNRASWNFYVGANFESKGQWSPADNSFFWNDLIPSMEAEEAEELLFARGVWRYTAMSVPQFATHMFNKLGVLLADVGNSIHDLKRTFANAGSVYGVLSRSINVYYWVLMACIFLLLLRALKQKHTAAEAFLPMLAFIGLTMAYMLVEVMNRYSSMLIALLIVIACVLSVPSASAVHSHSDTEL